MSAYSSQQLLTSPQETANLAARIAPHLRAGDTVLLEGPRGAGKTHFARAVILARISVPEDIPSPTYTMVQTYDAGDVEIWHCDLYRLTSPNEALELGLEDAFENSICLVEWPDRLADLAPNDGLILSFSVVAEAEHRHLTASAKSARWQPVLDLIHD